MTAATEGPVIAESRGEPFNGSLYTAGLLQTVAEDGQRRPWDGLRTLYINYKLQRGWGWGTRRTFPFSLPSFLPLPPPPPSSSFFVLLCLSVCLSVCLSLSLCLSVSLSLSLPPLSPPPLSLSLSNTDFKQPKFGKAGTVCQDENRCQVTVFGGGGCFPIRKPQIPMILTAVVCLENNVFLQIVSEPSRWPSGQGSASTAGDPVIAVRSGRIKD